MAEADHPRVGEERRVVRRVCHVKGDGAAVHTPNVGILDDGREVEVRPAVAEVGVRDGRALKVDRDHIVRAAARRAVRECAELGRPRRLPLHACGDGERSDE